MCVCVYKSTYSDIAGYMYGSVVRKLMYIAYHMSTIEAHNTQQYVAGWDFRAHFEPDTYNARIASVIVS